MFTEIASIMARDYLTERGLARAEIAYNNEVWSLYWPTFKVIKAVDAYLAKRIRLKHKVAARMVAFHGLDPDTPLFRSGDGESFQLTQHTTTTDVISYSCDSLSQQYRKPHGQARVDGANALSGCRTFAVRLYRKGYGLLHINELLGYATLTAPKRLIDRGSVKLGVLLAGVI